MLGKDDLRILHTKLVNNLDWLNKNNNDIMKVDSTIVIKVSNMSVYFSSIDSALSSDFLDEDYEVHNIYWENDNVSLKASKTGVVMLDKFRRKIPVLSYHDWEV